MQPLRRMARDAAKLLVAGTLFIYPIAMYIADGYLTPTQLLAGLLFLLAARVMLAAWIKPQHHRRDVLLAGLMAAAAILVLLFMPGVKLMWLRLYPALFGLAVLAMFFGSLFTSMPIVERFARIMHSDLPPQAIVHCRRVTQAWCVVILLNILVSLYTAFETSYRIWSLYNGCIVYFVFGTMLLGEYLLRLQLRRRWAKA
ncbi:MAG TPA: hypothetical protein VGO35_09000 [Gammaproteobacteria bacterium]|jgi:uncharacterized membrane protein|nr:hypothetical protein [Gammaproteobacteria bacterium]